jgi:putative addiction module killer protein
MLIVPLPHRVQEVEVNGKSPFREWLRKLKDTEGVAAVVSRIRRIEVAGAFGDYRYLAEGIFELKFKIGPGYRVYFGLQKGFVVLLLAGGDKSSQSQDIRKATELWQEYLKTLTE